MFRIPEKKWEKDCIQGVTKGPSVKLIVWGCIWRNQKGPLMSIIEKSMDRWAYIEILEEGLLDVLQEVQDTLHQ